MSKLTNDEKANYLDKLKYIGLDLENIPEFLKNYNPIEYRTQKRFDNKEYMVYRYVPIQKIQILITKANRLTDIKEKYNLAKPISEYIDPKNEEDIEDFSIFLNMLKNTEISEIEEIAKKQNELKRCIPYRIKYEKNYLWQIYYSEYTDQYFMLVPCDETEFSALFYLIKEQIQNDKNEDSHEFVYVPVCNIEPTDNILIRSERLDIENYLWLLTSKWPNIFELKEKDDSFKVVITGDVEVYPSIYATYRIDLNDREKANKFYKELKALFILQTELKDYYSFKPQIDDDGNLVFFYKGKNIDYANLSSFIKSEYIEAENNISKYKNEDKELTIKLETIKEEIAQKEKDFLEKQKQISTYLQYKKSFLGKVKYFFSRKKTFKKKEIKNEEIVFENENEQASYEQKINYTIEDLVVIYASFGKIEKSVKDKRLDYKALDVKSQNLSKKIENATLYINEIDSHKKSIFEFWRFSSKDNIELLNQGEEEETIEQSKPLKKTFDYESDRDDTAIEIDKKQRANLNKEDEDCIFAANSKILPILNKIKEHIKVKDEKLNELLEKLKEEVEKNKNTNSIEYDIFGALSEDRTKIKTLGKNKHRETEKNLYQILGINELASLQDFKNKLISIENNLSESLKKNNNIIDMHIYKAMPENEKIDLYGYTLYSMTPEDELKNIKTDKEELNLFKINLAENMPAIFYTNIIYFDNFNKTLPLGMDISNNVMIDSNNFSFILKDKKIVSTNMYFTEKDDASKLGIKKINIFEYDIEMKSK